MKVTIEGDGKGPVSRVHLPLVYYGRRAKNEGRGEGYVTARAGTL